jgi:hypothetical protein
MIVGLLGTEIDWGAVIESIFVPNNHSGTDYLLLHFWVLGACSEAGPIQI